MCTVPFVPQFSAFRRSAKILDHLAIDGLEVTIRAHDPDETGYPVNG